MKNIIRRILIYLKSLIHIADEIDYENASTSIRKNIAFKGTNVFILACAIIIASVGLNVNSIPVIIGAMLVSPVMGPILGFGLGLGTEDNHLVKESLKNFGVMVGISIIASSLFFLLSPLSLANPSELLARTNPTIYDVLIALFGGLAGIIETSRKDKGSVITGVAIATALMPPLCTVGYGLSLFNVHYIFGALYLFIINSIFIALATFLVTKYLKYPVLSEGDNRRRLTTRSVAILLLVVIIPSIFSAVHIVRESNFNRHVQQLVMDNRTIGRTFIYDYKPHYSTKHATVELFVAGPVPTEQEMESFYNKAEDYGIFRTQIVINDNNLVTSMSEAESDIVKDIFKSGEERQARLADSVRRLSDSLAAFRSYDHLNDAVAHEIMVQYPSVSRVLLGNARILSSGAEARCSTQYTVLLEASTPLSQSEMETLKAWLRVRLGREQVDIIQSTESRK